MHALVNAVILLLRPQPLNAILRPHPGTGPKRTAWEYLHKGTGYAAVAAGFAAIALVRASAARALHSSHVPPVLLRRLRLTLMQGAILIDGTFTVLIVYFAVAGAAAAGAVVWRVRSPGHLTPAEKEAGALAKADAGPDASDAAAIEMTMQFNPIRSSSAASI